MVLGLFLGSLEGRPQAGDLGDEGPIIEPILQQLLGVSLCRGLILRCFPIRSSFSTLLRTLHKTKAVTSADFITGTRPTSRDIHL